MAANAANHLRQGAMARMTQAQKIERDNQEQALSFFRETLAALPDARRRQGLRYPLQTVVVTALMAMVCGCDDAEAFSAVFRAWAELLSLRLQSGGKHIAVDGKTSRRSFDTASGKRAVHTVSAWMSEAGLVLGQQKTETKSNEITAIPELLSVKDNQPTLHEDLQTTFAEAADARHRTVDEQPRPTVEVSQDVDKGHGRLETRTVTLCRDLSWVTTADRWSGLSLVAQVVRQRTVLSTGKTSTETAYYIGSDTGATAATASAAIRRHWSIENSLHWVLDLAFREDEARHRAKNTAVNMTTLRHFALNIIKSDPDRKLGVANTRKRAGWDRDYLIKLLTDA